MESEETQEQPDERTGGDAAGDVADGAAAAAEAAESAEDTGGEDESGQGEQPADEAE